MSLRTRIGNLSNILDEDEKQCDHLQLNSPVLSINQFKTMRQYMKDTVKVLDTTMDITDSNNNFEKALLDLNRQAEKAVREGYVHIILSDKNLSKNNVALPMILATSSVHSHLISKSLRTYISLKYSICGMFRCSLFCCINWCWGDEYQCLCCSASNSGTS